MNVSLRMVAHLGKVASSVCVALAVHGSLAGAKLMQLVLVTTLCFSQFTNVDHAIPSVQLVQYA